MGSVTLMNGRTRRFVASDVELALTRASGGRGLLGRDGLDPCAALILVPSVAVHTAFMRFAIDVVFVDRHGRALKIVRELAPWRIALAPLAHAVIELAGGSLRSRDVSIGDRLYLAPLWRPVRSVDLVGRHRRDLANDRCEADLLGIENAPLVLKWTKEFARGFRGSAGFWFSHASNRGKSRAWAIARFWRHFVAQTISHAPIVHKSSSEVTNLGRTGQWSRPDARPDRPRTRPRADGVRARPARCRAARRVLVRV